MLGFVLRISDRLRHRARSRKWTAVQAAGRRGEDIAHRYLRRHGFVVVARNYRPPAGAGEVDLVAWEGDRLVFVEVKSRATDEFGSPSRAMGEEKKAALARAARDYARRANVPPERIRFDVVEVILGAPPSVSHRRDAFSPWTD